MSLNLNREMIRGSIEKFFLMQSIECSTSDFEDKGATRKRIHIKTEENIFYMDFHFLKKGGTSIDTSSGGNKDIKEEIKVFISSDSECALGEVDSPNKFFVAPNIEYKDFDAIIELLKESEFSKGHRSESFPNHYTHKFTGKYDESLTIHYYTTTNKTMVQGKPLLLFNEALTFISELIDLEEIPKVFNDLYKINIEKDFIEEQYEHYFPNSHHIFSNKMKKVLFQAVYNIQIKGEMYDQTFLVFPALKALEGYLKIELQSHSIPLNNNKFNMFEKSVTSDRYKLKEEFEHNISNDKKTHLEDSYNFYRKHRHNLFHWADPSAPVDETRIIENYGEINGLLVNTFKLIDEYYLLN